VVVAADVLHLAVGVTHLEADEDGVFERDAGLFVLVIADAHIGSCLLGAMNWRCAGSCSVALCAGTERLRFAFPQSGAVAPPDQHRTAAVILSWRREEFLQHCAVIARALAPVAISASCCKGPFARSEWHHCDPAPPQASRCG